MLYKLFILLICSTILSGQSLFNRWVGTESFSGSAKSTAMGNTHLLNSIGSANTRFNPSSLSSLDSKIIINIQANRFSTFERWSMPVRDSFDEVLAYADYTSNEFNYYSLSGGIAFNTKLLKIGKVGIGLYHAPLTHFIYNYSEEVRGTYRPGDNEYASKDPIIGYQQLKSDGNIMVSSIGGGMKIYMPANIDLSIGISSNFIQSTGISDIVNIDTLSDNITNLSKYPDVQKSSRMFEANFITLSAKCKINSNIAISVLWEDSIKNNINSIGTIDPTNGLLQYWDNTTYEDSTFYTPEGMYYIKPTLKSLAFNYTTNTTQNISISFEYNDVLYGGHPIFKDYNIYKFGFEYLTQMGTPIRGGLTYQTPKLIAMNPVSTFTFGTGKTIGNLNLDIAGTYCFHSFKYPDLFPVEDDTRTDYDLVRESQLQLYLAISYRF